MKEAWLRVRSSSLPDLLTTPASLTAWPAEQKVPAVTTLDNWGRSWGRQEAEQSQPLWTACSVLDSISFSRRDPLRRRVPEFLEKCFFFCLFRKGWLVPPLRLVLILPVRSPHSYWPWPFCEEGICWRPAALDTSIKEYCHGSSESAIEYCLKTKPSNAAHTQSPNVWISTTRGFHLSCTTILGSH